MTIAETPKCYSIDMYLEGIESQNLEPCDLQSSIAAKRLSGGIFSVEEHDAIIDGLPLGYLNVMIVYAVFESLKSTNDAVYLADLAFTQIDLELQRLLLLDEDEFSERHGVHLLGWYALNLKLHETISGGRRFEAYREALEIQATGSPVAGLLSPLPSEKLYCVIRYDVPELEISRLVSSKLVKECTQS